jgi:hypothetical protein
VAGKSPEEWVNQDVLVEIFTGAVEYQVVARLDGINDCGIVLTGAEPGGGTVLYP